MNSHLRQPRSHHVGLLCAVLLVLTCTPPAPLPCLAWEGFRKALAGYEFTFPSDHFAHEDYAIEWWYYTGHLRTEGGRWYGYELTFFRYGLEPSPAVNQGSQWAIQSLYFAHFAVSDEKKKRFYYRERISRGALGMAGASTDSLRVWVEDWSLEGKGDRHLLKASSEGHAIDLTLSPVKALVIHGREGISKKGAEDGHASHYYSYTRLATVGRLTIDGKTYEVSGLSWMDHEFSSDRLAPYQAGWDWFSIQLDNHVEIMLYQIRHTGGGLDPFSSGTIVRADGATEHLTLDDFQVRALSQWRSKRSGARYPMGWHITIPGRAILLTVTPAFEEQELNTEESTRISYWEGSCKVAGTYGGRAVRGMGYTELTGYAQPLGRSGDRGS